MSLVEPADSPPWESPQWQEAVSQNPGLAPFFDNLESFVELPEGIEKLRNVFLRLAVQGKLVAQDPSDEPADSLMERALSERKEIIKKYRLRSTTEFEPVTNDEQPDELPNGWRWCRFGEFGAFMGGGTPSKGNSAYWSGDIPWVTPKDMKRPLIEDAIDHVSQEGIDNSSAKLIPPESLLIVVRGMILIHSFPIAISKRELTINQDMKAIVLGEKQLANYLLLLGQASRDRMLEVVQRSSHGTCRIATEDVERFVVGLPPLAEQRRIVSKVEGLMSLCDTLESQGRSRESVRERASRSVLASLTSASAPLPAGTSRATSTGETLQSSWQRLSDHFEVLLDQPESLADLRQSILQLAVQGKLVPQDPNDECVDTAIAQARKAAEMKQVQIEPVDGEFDIPSNWRWVTVHDVAEHRLGKMLDKAKNTGNPQPYLRNTNVHWFRFELDSIKEMLFEDDEIEEFEVKQGDLLICEGGHGIARTAVWECELDRVMFQKALHRVRPLQCLDSYFLAFCLRVYESTGILQRYYTGAGIPHFTGRSLAKVEFPLAPLAEQKRIVSKVSVLLSQLDELSARLRSRQSATDALLTALIDQILKGTK